jgi:hypothetical protein
MDIDSSPGILPPSSNRLPSSSQTRTPTRSQGRTTTTASTRTGTAAGRSRATRNALSLGDEDDEMGNPFNANNNNSNRNGNRGGGTRDAMSEDDGIPGSQAEEDGMNPARGGAAKGRRARMNLDVPPVRDATGEKVMESFEVFLKT